MHNPIIPLIATITLAMCGCIHTDTDTENHSNAEVDLPTVKTATTCAVVIGMENSRFAGACPGAKFDSDRMYALISKYAQRTVLLQDAKATRANVRSAIEKGIAESGSGLFILYYSGHGGSDPFPDTGIEEVDGSDEYLCLYDTYMRDNEIWSLISKSKGRLWLINDCCHSCTLFRGLPLSLKAVMPLTATHEEDGVISMQCWSGCPDDTYSYGSATGGQFTNAFLRYFKDPMTYDGLWEKIESDKTLQIYERVQRTVMGRRFGATPVFR